MYIDKVSGKNFNRPEYKKLMRQLKEGDKLIIKSIDRLGRNYEEIMKQWRKITKEIGADITVLDMPLFNTDIVRENLTGVFISDLVLQILAYVAETERSFIKQRQMEGIAIAKSKGVKFGRRKKEIPEKFDIYYEKRDINKKSNNGIRNESCDILQEMLRKVTKKYLICNKC